ncbi:hypothetical protein J2T02_005200 [Chitinophaga terrae (ex Kim and Jung 2007)]|uniref:hypothetical protein n=1 Tax=Chitinophaga terrae (ex Kim and Jung 2007) TaxID=408074 RepID=UPI002780E704|nr:hypothetical protein [Chitinophaga terrae (ex Kim and Jung 2007)]MDQ0110052.1 hypothetical protein [Chitinophaga terrae (ex Kim and Jung 2007)]
MRIAGIGGSYFLRFIKGTADPLFITYIILYLLVRGFRSLSLPLPWVNNWLTDFLFIPVAAHLSLSFTRYIVLKNAGYKYPLYYLLLMALYTALVFELIIPCYVSSAVADWGDVIAYFAGTFFYYLFHQPKAH